MNTSSFLFKDGKSVTYSVVRIGMCSAVLFVSQIALSFIPNTELVSLLTVIFSLVFGYEAVLMVTIFSLLEGMLYGFGLWVLSYLYVWPILVIVTVLLKNVIKDDFIMWSLVSGSFGLIFGSLFAVAYIPISPSYALSYWISGLPWDVWHCISNVVVMMVLGKPIYKVIRRVGK